VCVSHLQKIDIEVGYLGCQYDFFIIKRESQKKESMSTYSGSELQQGKQNQTVGSIPLNSINGPFRVK